MLYFFTKPLQVSIFPKKVRLSIISLYSFARPRIFLKTTKKLLPFTLILSTLFLISGLYASLILSPPDYQQGDLVRILYVHVPASWMALMLYSFVTAMSALVFVWRSPLAEILAVSTVPLGALLTFLSLITGSLWGKLSWGAFWVWDARLTSVLLLLLTYAGYAFIYKVWGARAASLFALLGAFNLPIIKGSVNWWNTLHQPASVAKLSAPSLHSSMLIPLLLMAATYFFYSISLVILRAQTLLTTCKTRRILRHELI